MTISETGKPKASHKGAVTGFTLLEVLVAFAILAAALTVVSAAFSRHLTALRLLEKSLLAHQIAQEQLIQETVRRLEAGLKVPPQTAVPGFTPSIRAESFTFSQEPIKDLAVDRTRGEVLWDFRGQGRRSEISTVFPPEPE